MSVKLTLPLLQKPTLMVYTVHQMGYNPTLLMTLKPIPIGMVGGSQILCTMEMATQYPGWRQCLSESLLGYSFP